MEDIKKDKKVIVQSTKQFDSLNSVFLEINAEQKIRMRIKNKLKEKQTKYSPPITPKMIDEEIKKMAPEEYQKEKEELLIHDSENSKDTCSSEETCSNYRKKLKGILRGVYSYLYGKEPHEFRFVVTPVTCNVIYTLLKMDSSRKESFVSKVKSRRFDEITPEEKIDFIDNAFNRLFDLVTFEKTNRPSVEIPDDFKRMFDGLIAKENDTEINVIQTLYLEDWQEQLNEIRQKIVEEILFEEQEKKAKEEISNQIIASIKEVFPRDPVDNILFPLFENAQNSQHSLDNFSEHLGLSQKCRNSTISLLNIEEKQYILDLLISTVETSMQEWKRNVSNALEEKMMNEESYIWEFIES